MERLTEINKKVVLGVLTLVLILAIVAVSSFIPFIIDPTRFMTNEFLTNELIVVAITLSTTITVMFIATASNADNPKSELCKSRVQFKNSITEIDDLTKFYQWVKKVLRKRDKEEIVDREMMRIGLESDIYYLSPAELKALTEQPQKYNDKFYKKLEKEQYREILYLQKKMLKLKFVSPNYYTSVKNIEPHKTNSEKASSETKKKVSYVLINISTKVVLTLVFAMIVASLVKDATSQQSMSQAWMNFLSRMFSFISSSFLGWTIGSKLNDIDAFYIHNRIEAHRLYREDKDFVKVDEAKEEYIERVKEEQLLIGLKEREETIIIPPTSHETEN